MKKLIALLLAALLCLGTMLPALAENETEARPETFPYMFSEYKTYFDFLSENLFGITPEWGADVEALIAMARVEGFGDTYLEVDAEEYVKTVITMVSIPVADDTQITTAANSFGQLVALITLSSRAAQDVSTFTNETINAVQNELVEMISELMSHVSDALNGPVTLEHEVDGDLCTLVMSFDLEAMTLTFGFMLQP